MSLPRGKSSSSSISARKSPQSPHPVAGEKLPISDVHFKEIVLDDIDKSMAIVNLIIGWKELDLEIRRLKLQLKQSVNLFQATSTENNYRKVDEKLQKQEPAKENWQADAFIEVSKAVSAFRRYFVGEIEKATDNFSNERKVADGGLGHVFKSALDHNAVVIKIFRSDFVQSEDLFQMEFGANLHVKGFLLPCFRFLHLTQILGGKIEWPLPPKRDKLPWCLL
ncbi:hypothetical protein HPP92_012617 [Vanilla planifolia]|uniref:RING-type E3 ubiquitin transferase n=1 Tax=Vanilla planifolia TaxID=51239 RepID=A0A835QU38_VANPL|nr:hypothetical protein HPP92_012617 [Vanilla planifolia]